MKFARAERIHENIHDSVEYGTQKLHYTLHYARRKTLAIHVENDGALVVEAPEDTPLQKVRDAVKAKGRWIQQKRQEVDQLAVPLPEREYVSGESYRYLGRQYRLKVLSSDRNRVKLTRGMLYLEIRDPHDQKLKESVLEGWFLERAKVIFHERLQHLLVVARRSGIPEPSKVSVRRMKTRWGSCSKSGHVLLNTELVKAPKDSIDYVILHELCHLKVHRHNQEFYGVLSRVCPEWQEARKRLNQLVELKL